MTEIRKLTAREAAPVRLKIVLTDDNWERVMEHGASKPQLISEDGEFFIVQFPTRAEYENNLETWCGLVDRAVEISITEKG